MTLDPIRAAGDHADKQQSRSERIAAMHSMLMAGFHAARRNGAQTLVWTPEWSIKWSPVVEVIEDYFGSHSLSEVVEILSAVELGCDMRCQTTILMNCIAESYAAFHSSDPEVDDVE